MPVAWLLSIGNELLVGRITNTNATWLARKLTFMGFTVKRIITVPDEIEDIRDEITRSLPSTDLVITTGGLGPTYDDRTAEAIAHSLGLELEENREALEMVKDFYSRRGMPLTPERVKMAVLPRGSKVFPNPVGAAPAFAVEVEDTVVIALPGVPSEMKSIFERYIEGFLREKFSIRRHFVEYCVVIEGIPESTLAPIINALAKKYSGSAYLKSHPKGHETEKPVLEIRVLTAGDEKEEAEKLAKVILEEVVHEALGLGGKAGEIKGEC